MEKICRIDMTKKKSLWKDFPKEYSRFGGRALVDKIMLNESNPLCDPFGPESFLIFANGLLTGTTAPTSHRTSVGGKSPLTGGIKESNAGGITSLRLSQLGLRALIITGKPQSNETPFVLHLKENNSDLVSMPDLKYQGVYETAEVLKRRFGEDCGMAIIGPAGERCFRASSVCHMDRDGNPTRFSGRGGLGAVMGSKSLKAVVIEKGTHQPEICDKKLFEDAAKEFIAAIKESNITAEVFPKYGTPIIIRQTNELGCLPTRNFSSGQFELADRIDGEHMYELITQRGGAGKTTHACMPGCTVRCSNVFPDKNGNVLVGPLEYETIALLGSNCGIGDLDQIAELNRMCNDLGIDTIETGGAIAVAMEAGDLRFGSFKDAKETIEKIKGNDYLGRIIANGVKITGQVLGVDRVPQSKGQGFPGYDPRGTKTVGVAYALSPMGADHTGGTGMTTPHVDRLSPNGHVDNSRQLQCTFAGVDYIGICVMASEAITEKPSIIDRLIKGKCGWSPGEDAFRNLGREILKMEREFNLMAGWNAANDDVPEYLRKEPLPPNNTVFDVSKDEMKAFYDFSVKTDR
jgi:aldehyde:ferredoxin oxidoreductase